MYHTVTLLRGVGGAANPLLPQDAEQMRAWADHAARRVRSVDPVFLDVDGQRARVLDLERGDDGAPRAFVKVYTQPPHTRVIPVREGMLGYDGGDRWIAEMMPRLASSQTIPVRFMHRDNQLAGRFLDVWIDEADPTHALAYVSLDGSDPGRALQLMLAGDGELPAMAGFSIEVDAVSGEPFPAELTGGVFTAVPRLAESRQQVEITEDVAGKGGSDYAFDTAHLTMADETVAMNTEVTAVEGAAEMKLNTGADDYGMEAPPAKKVKAADGTAKKTADNDLVAEMNEKVKRAAARVDAFAAREAMNEMRAASNRKFGELLDIVRQRKTGLPAAEAAKMEKTIAVIEKLHNKQDDEVMDMRLENENVISDAMKDFSFHVHAVIETEAAVEAARAEMRAEMEAREAERQAAIAQVRSQAERVIRSADSVGTASYSFQRRLPAAPAPVPAASSTTAQAKQQDDGDAEFTSALATCLVAPMGADYSFGGSASFTSRDEELTALAREARKRGIPPSVFLGRAYTQPQRAKKARARED